MNAFQPAAKENGLLEVADARIGVGGRSDIVEGKDRPGDELQADEEEERAPEDVGPADIFGDRASEEGVEDRPEPRAVVDPTANAPDHNAPRMSKLPMYKVPFSILVAYW